jgi:heme-degrading monooxygenase HmoA
MAVKILIKRQVPEGSAEFLKPLLIALRNLTMNQKGYIGGETLKRVDEPGYSLVISTWKTIEDWNRWQASSERADIQSKIDTLLGKETEYEIYTYG